MCFKPQTLSCSCVRLKHGTAINNACHSFSRNISSWTTGQFVFPGMRVCIVWGRPLDLHFKYTKSFETLLLLSHCCRYFVPPSGPLCPSWDTARLQNIWFVFRSRRKCSSLELDELCGVWWASQSIKSLMGKRNVFTGPHSLEMNLLNSKRNCI